MSGNLSRRPEYETLASVVIAFYDAVSTDCNAATARIGEMQLSEAETAMRLECIHHAAQFLRAKFDIEMTGVMRKLALYCFVPFNLTQRKCLFS